MIKHIINGQKVESKETFQTINPATGEVIAEVASAGEAEVNAAVAAAKAAFPGWAATPVKERARLVRKLGELIAANVEPIADLETADCGQVTNQTKRVLIPRASHERRRCPPIRSAPSRNAYRLRRRASSTRAAG